MTTKPKDGGPAFPMGITEGVHRTHSAYSQTGMTLRDWFAGMALNAIIEDVNRPNAHEQGDSPIHPTDGIALRAYRIADAMLAVRERKENS